jgi:cytochrome P450
MPAVVQTAIWFRRAQWMMSQCAARFGETFSLRIMHESAWVMLSNPEHVKQVFTGDPKVFHAGEGNQILRPVLGAHSLLLLDEQEHLQQRKLLLPQFHGARMQSYRELMAEVARREVQDWPRGAPYRLRPRMQALTLEIILRAVFGLSEGERIERLRCELRRLLDRLSNPSTFALPVLMGPERLSRFGPFQSLMRRVDSLIYDEIAERRSTGDLAEREDILSLLLQARHADGGQPMSDVELRDQLLTLLVAGHETTANALAWAVERLAHHPDKLGRLRREVMAGETTYLDAVVIETLRLRPVISLVARRLTQPVQIGEWQLPAGVTVTPSIYLVHRRPDIYPNPESFEPERFLDEPGPDDPGAAHTGEPGGRVGGKPGTYTWIPFGGGVRRCLGGAFAQFEMGVVLSELVKRWDIEPARAGAEPVRRRAITETPRHDAEVVLV